MPETGFVTARVAIENASYSYDKLYDYLIPEALSGAAVPGCRVRVSFGHGLRQGMIMSLGQISDKAGYKSISQLIDKEPVMSEELLQMAQFMKSRCFCTLFDACSAMLPTGLFVKLTFSYSAPEGGEYADALLTDEERAAAAYLRARKRAVREDLLIKHLGLPDASLLRSLSDRGIIQRHEDVKRRVLDATVRMIRLKGEVPERKYTPAQSEVIKVLSDIGEVSVKELCYFTGVGISVPDNLVKKGICEYFETEPPREAAVGELPEPEEIRLTPDQQRAYDGLSAKLGEASVSLLYGVTGSGKTSVFMKLIDDVSGRGEGVICMVPEISLTPQMLAKFRARYGERVAVFHSGLSLGKRLEEWRRVKNGEAVIAVGTRSAIFAPFSKLGLIIMDEEQEYSYKSSASPRFHARDLAKFRCSYGKCPLLLCSATPCVESYEYAKNGRYSLFELPSRYGGATLPHVVTVDMNRERDQGNTSGYSSVLLEALEENLEDGRQSIILLNRRGHNTYITCRSCGETINCPNCSISMTYHSANGRLMCHYCGHSVPMPKECPSCGSDKLRCGGSGTQRAEQELSELFPKARILRLDTDSTMRRFAYEKKLSAFRNGEYDIMLGTQMVAKGLDFPDVTLVGVLSADGMMHGDDFRSYERTFALLTQVVGRSGRGGLEGRAMIQTFEPNDPIISLAAAQNYDEFFRTEISLRRSMLYPPFADIGYVAFISEDKGRAFEASRFFAERFAEGADRIEPKLPLRVIGPSPAGVPRVGGKYRYKLIIKYKNSRPFRELMSGMLVSIGQERRFSDVNVFFDPDPENIL